MSRHRIKLRPVARRELLDAVAWYDRESSKLGDRLLVEVNEGLEKVHANPESCSFTYLGTRAYRLPGFPYLIYYLKQGDEIVVFGFLHEKEDSLRLRRRIK